MLLLQYTNELLEQVRHLEEKQLLYQREAHEKQSALRQALAACDAARTEVLDGLGRGCVCCVLWWVCAHCAVHVVLVLLSSVLSL